MLSLKGTVSNGNGIRYHACFVNKHMSLWKKKELFQFLELASIFQTAIYIYCLVSWCLYKDCKKNSPSLY